MTIKYADRVFETTTTTGTGTIDLNGALAGYQTFIDGVGAAENVPYAIFDNLNWEVGRGLVVAGSPDQLQRTVVLSSSNANAAINWGTGTRNVILPLSSTFGVWRDENLNDVSSIGLGGGTANAQTVTMTPTPLAYSNGMIVRWIATVANTAAMTINVNGLGAKNYVDGLGAAFGSGAIAVGSLQQAFYDLANNRFVSLSLVSNVTAVANGGTGVATLTSGQFPVGQGTSPVVMSSKMTYNTANNQLTLGDNTSPQQLFLQVNAGNAQFPTNMSLTETGHATSRRAGIALGTHWNLITDVNGNGTRDLGFFNSNISASVLQIDTAGRVTATQQPLFLGQRSAGNVVGAADFVANSVVINRGSHYNTTTGIFTCPVAGDYMISFYGGGAAAVQVAIQYNGSTVVTNFTGVTAVVNAVIACAASDQLKIRVLSGTVTANATTTNSISIRLLA